MLEQENFSESIADKIEVDKKIRNKTFGKSAMMGLSVLASIYIGHAIERSGFEGSQVFSLIPAYVFYDRCRRLLFDGVKQFKNVASATNAQSNIALHEARVQSSTEEIVKCLEATSLSDHQINNGDATEIDVIRRLVHDVGVAMMNRRFIFVESEVKSDGEVTSLNASYQSTIDDESFTSQDGTDFQLVFTYSSSSGHIDTVVITRRTIWSNDTKSSMHIHNPRTRHKGSTGFINEVISLVQLVDGADDDHEHCTYHPQLINELLLCGYQIDTQTGKTDDKIVFIPTQECKPWEGYKRDEPIVLYFIGVLNGNAMYAVSHKKFGFYI